MTGANKGLGYEIAKGLAGLGMHVGVGARDDGRREEAVDRLRADGAEHVFGVPLDVTDDASVAAAIALVEDRAGGLDVLVNNAGITGGMTGQAPLDPDVAMVARVVDTNVLGPIRMIDAALPLLRRSSAPRIVNVSSTVGSLTRQSEAGVETGPLSIAYSPSKTFLNGVTVQYAKALADTPIKVNAVCPGFVATDLNGHAGSRTPEQGARSAIQLATIPDDGPTGGFFSDEGPIPW